MKLKNYIVDGVIITLVLIFAGVIVLRQPLRENLTAAEKRMDAATDKATACTTCSATDTSAADRKKACNTCGATGTDAANKVPYCKACALPDRVITDKTASDEAAATKKTACEACGIIDKSYTDPVFGIVFTDEMYAYAMYAGIGIVVFIIIGFVLTMALRQPAAPPPVYGMGRRRR